MCRFAFRWMTFASVVLVFIFTLATTVMAQGPPSIGIFAAQADIGTVLHPGTASYDSSEQTYTVSGSGGNTWFGSDEFHFVWLKASGDVSLAADIALLGSTGKPHRKAMLMIRQSLSPDSPYVDVAVHGIGKTSLQFRDSTGANTRTIASTVYGPKRVMLQKRGDFFYAYLSGKDSALNFAGSSTRLALTGEFYVGLGVCSHDEDAVQSARFSHLRYRNGPGLKGQNLHSTLETVVIGSQDRQVEFVAPGRVEAPNWSKDGSFFLFNRDGGIFRVPVKCGAEDAGCAGPTEPVRVVTDPVSRYTNDHGISPDGNSLAISGKSAGSHGWVVYTLPLAGGTPRQVTTEAPSFWHGWSPDGQTVAFMGRRTGSPQIFTIPLAGGQERALTTDQFVSDGPEYSPDGRYIYFSSNRSGSSQIWRMRPDGAGAEQVVSDVFNDWFPHVSPDGQWLVYLSYDKNIADHPGDKNVILHLMSLKDREVKVLATLLGGEGTINGPSWSPDSRKLAFMSYEFLPVDDDERK